MSRRSSQQAVLKPRLVGIGHRPLISAVCRKLLEESKRHRNERTCIFPGELLGISALERSSRDFANHLMKPTFPSENRASSGGYLEHHARQGI